MKIFGTIIAIFIMLLMFISAFWVYDELKYSWKMNKEMNDNNATCYFDRGLFNFPLARVCTYNKTIIVEKEEIGNKNG